MRIQKDDSRKDRSQRRSGVNPLFLLLFLLSVAISLALALAL